MHLICALYTPGVTFGEIDILSAVSTFEMSYGGFGRKPCALCVAADKTRARIGATVKCDAGMCKSFFHVTCAYRAGLLIDVVGDQSEQTVADPYYIHCLAHSDHDSMRLKRRHVAFIDRQTREIGK